MSMYRIDRYETSPADPAQELGFCDWMGGPTLSNIRGCLVEGEPGLRRSARITGEPDTFFSQPAQVSMSGQTVRGFLTVEDGVYTFHPNN